MGSKVITLLTDFGIQDPFVGVMKGVILRISPDATVVDLCHGVPPQDVRAGALILRQAASFFPSGTIHVAVVDPGVGAARRGVLVETRAYFLIGPDNGLLSLAAPPSEIVRAVHLTNEAYFLARVSNTFHGRDVFAPVAAHLAAGVAPCQFGPELPSIERLHVAPVRSGEGRLEGEVVYVDRFGNLVTNIAEAALGAFSAKRLSVSMGGGRVRIEKLSHAYSEVEEGELVALVNSWGYVEIAVRNGSAQARTAISVGEPVTVTAEETPRVVDE